MEIFLKATAAVIIALIFYLILLNHGKDLSVLLSVTVCCIVSLAAVRYLEPVTEFFEKIHNIGKLDTTMLQIIMRSVGIGLLSEITSHICTDSGNAALGKTLQILGNAIILWLSLPIFTKMIELIEEILITI